MRDESAERRNGREESAGEHPRECDARAAEPRSDELGRIAGGIAHELRSPLNVIRTSVYFLLRAPSASEERRTEHLLKIERQVGIADEILTALADFARSAEPFREAIRAKALLDEIFASFEWPSGIAARLEIDMALPPLHGDPRQLAILFRNLIRNAVDAMPDGGTILVDAAASGEWVSIRVSDTGCGMSPESIQKLGEPLRSTKARGLGLGLALSRDILERHGAHWIVESEPGKGSTFTLQFPRSRGDEHRERDASCSGA